MRVSQPGSQSVFHVHAPSRVELALALAQRAAAVCVIMPCTHTDDPPTPERGPVVVCVTHGGVSSACDDDAS